MKMKENYGFPAVGSCRALTVNILYYPETVCFKIRSNSKIIWYTNCNFHL